jgi:hypothetical protein
MVTINKTPQRPASAPNPASGGRPGRVMEVGSGERPKTSKPGTGGGSGGGSGGSGGSASGDGTS